MVQALQPAVAVSDVRCGTSSSSPPVRSVCSLKERRRLSRFLQSSEQFHGAAISGKCVSRPAVVASLAERATPALQVPRVSFPGKVTYKAIVSATRKINPDFVGDLLKQKGGAIKDELNSRLDIATDAIADVFGQRVLLELISEEIDPATGSGKRSKESHLTNWLEHAWGSGTDVEYTAEFTVDGSFGTPGAITVVNKHKTELYIKTISLTSVETSQTYYFPCSSYVDSFGKLPQKRVFFRNTAYLPEDTPAGLKEVREKQLASVRGNGTGVRKTWERIYEYDVYNDLGNGDANEDLARPILGGNEDLPYPRRCRTGRPQTNTDPSKETVEPPTGSNYVPRDEAFLDVKQADFVAGSLRALVQQLLPASLTKNTATPTEFDTFDDIDDLFKYDEQEIDSNGFIDGFFSVARKIFTISGEKDADSGFQYPSPLVVEGDKFRWMRDDEFGRQVLAGVNPVVVERLKVFPPESSLDTEVYGRKESALTKEHLEKNLEGLSVAQAIEEKRLYIVDNHDLYLPFVNRINALQDRKTYASRVLFFYTSGGIFKPVAIELSLPPPEAGSQGRKQVFTPGEGATNSWLWQLAKIHFCAVDAGIHQLASHWLRTHACTEPYILATRRQLSALHPIAKLLHDHFRYTLQINGAARLALISAGGTIEQTFTPGKYSMEISSAIYKHTWRFDKESLPADLIRRGMAEKTPQGGLQLTIEDYPYAADGLLIWNAITSWVEEYVSIYYSDNKVVEDTELQAWWTEIRREGHADKQEEPWWPDLKSTESLVHILTTIIWVSSAQHAAVNFGQYAYGGYIPNRPTLARRLIPEENSPEYEAFLARPEKFFLATLPNQVQATKLMSTVQLLSTHSRDEEFIGERPAHWTEDERALAAFDRFSSAIQAVGGEIDRRNRNADLKLRTGAAVIPYLLLHPRTEFEEKDGKQVVVPGVTGRGVPNSVSI